jgi:lipoprotein LprG
VTVLLAAALISACTAHHAASLPAGPTLVQRSAATMRAVRSVRFSLAIEGHPGALGIRRADGVMARGGRLSGTVQLEESGELIEYRVVESGGTLYLKGPTGPFQAVPAALAAGVYDPTQLLDPSTGVAAFLASARGARTVAREEVGGVDVYRVEAAVRGGEPLRQLIPDAPTEPVPATLWIGTATPDLLRIELGLPGDGSTGSASTVTIDLSAFDAPVAITPPPT